MRFLMTLLTITIIPIMPNIPMILGIPIIPISLVTLLSIILLIKPLVRGVTNDQKRQPLVQPLRQAVSNPRSNPTPGRLLWNAEHSPVKWALCFVFSRTGARDLSQARPGGVLRS